MKLTRYTDYAMRVMIHLGTHDDRLASIPEIARIYDLSHSNLMKVVQDLGHAGYVETVRGRHGGVRLARPADQINLGELVRHTEAGFDLVDCQGCLIAPACGLPGILAEATRAFLSVLDKYTVADLLGRRSALRQLFAIVEPEINRA
ncbi:transcriptional regulator, BadM/Rrf2 family [Ancylobacter novellus DSM 506]|jgi:Rrf2 family nitric oxide-sensitive transcriptional repressor|uniref:Transcriptional regulator, BadM/Rrf2 family n=1 Tax=Ancylobacter novellus (strain ATCC 8093 / DSM 506 / JCM 20403 / CCM 1077 / IAM 12100 / NBRC 12443 / NCIMB 10456) TaxID=639283 RepID=D7A7Q0_ANCN5|nr:Rrf2 family transcriptional regulator [Ancylobacter novellus]ADH88498.1 transcriptional regulator, BadM/Rrf2 family [Ancylobacter novellus DSM 506]MDF2810244.1 transcriptional regulator, BadM/Rrf2 family [Microvirga sp.]